MAKSDHIQNESAPKGNSEDSLLVIYILQILKKYSSRDNQLSSQDVMEHLREDYSVCDFDEADPKRKEKAAAQQKKVRRLLDTLYESYPCGCIKKVEGKTRNGHKWYYDITRDKFTDNAATVHETLTETEVDFLVDLVSSVKVLNSEGTCGLADKLLKKTAVSDKDRERRLKKIQNEEWFKTPNSDLVEKKELIEEEYFDGRCLTFSYENEESITATPVTWHDNDGICFLYAKVGDEYREFSLDKIRICEYDAEEYEDVECFGEYGEETDVDKTTLDSLFVNIPTIKSAIADKKCLHFLYRSYVVDGDRVASTDEEKSVLPHSLVFNNGKYYLIGIDENTPELNKVVYFRVDLMFELYYAETKNKLSNWDKHIYDTIERARLVEKHPLMLEGKDVPITFKVVESALDRVIDAFAVKPDKFDVTKETRLVEDSFGEGFHEEMVVRVTVRTTVEEAFRWALANADAVEVISQDVRDRIARIADPIYQLYTQTMPDKVRENFDYVLKEGIFKISCFVDEDTAYETYEELAKRGKLGVVDTVGAAGEDICELGDYFGDFINAKRLELSTPNLKNISWASGLVNLEGLELEDIHIDDTSWIRSLKKLREVQILESSISDLSVLSDHEDIWYLDISGTEVSDISFIQNYRKLDYLNIVACPIKDYSPLLTMQSRLNCLEIDKRALALIGEDRIRERHIGIDIIPRPNTPFWRSLM